VHEPSFQFKRLVPDRQSGSMKFGSDRVWGGEKQGVAKSKIF
jgi:hypothetical protein